MPDPIRSIALITSDAGSLVNFRAPLMQEMVAAGLRVWALAPDFDAPMKSALQAIGVDAVEIHLERTGMRPLRDLADLVRLRGVLSRLSPDATLAYFVKPVIYGSLAARLAKVPRRFAVMAGLGFPFTFGGSETVRIKALRRVVARMYAAGFGVCERVFFHNSDDLAYAADHGMITPAKAVVLNGTGVDLQHFAAAPVPAGPPRFLLIARLLKEKGVREFADAARSVRNVAPDARFDLVGPLDTNPGGLAREEVEAWVADGSLRWYGAVGDVRPYIAASTVYVLPSYREGKPRSTQEALALGRAVITTDAPGCRDTVEEGVNGFKVPVGDAEALAAAMLRFVRDPSLAAVMGAKGRRLAEDRFDVRLTNRTIMSTLGIAAASAIDRSRFGQSAERVAEPC